MSQSSARFLSLALLGLLACASTASAAELELTPFWGYTWGGDLDAQGGQDDRHRSGLHLADRVHAVTHRPCNAQF
jgi:hypothetical protein